MKKTLHLFLVIVSLSFLIIGNACAGNFGKLVPDRNVAKTFETHTVLETHNYYIYGPDNVPHVIIAVDKNHTLKKGFWKSVNPNSKQLKGWLDLMEMQSDSNPGLGGAKIIDANGNQIGIWYSRVNRTTIKIEENNEVNIYTPNSRDLIQRGNSRGLDSL